MHSALHTQHFLTCVIIKVYTIDINVLWKSGTLTGRGTQWIHQQGHLITQGIQKSGESWVNLLICSSSRSMSINLVCKLCHTEWGKGSRMSIPGRQNRGLTWASFSLKVYCVVYCILKRGDAYFAVLTLIGLISLLTRAFVTACGAVLKEGGVAQLYSNA